MHESFATRLESHGATQVTMAVLSHGQPRLDDLGYPCQETFTSLLVGFPTWEWIPLHPNSVHFHVFPASQNPTPNLHSPVHPLVLVGWGYGMLWDSKTMKSGAQKKNHPANIFSHFETYHPQHRLATNGHTLVCSPKRPCQSPPGAQV